MPNCEHCEHGIYTMNLQNAKCQDCNQKEKIIECMNQQRDALIAHQRLADDEQFRQYFCETQKRLSEIDNRLHNIRLYWEDIMQYLDDNKKAIEYIKYWDRTVEDLIGDATVRSGENPTPGNGPTKGDNGPVLF